MSELLLYFSYFFQSFLSYWWLWLAILLYAPAKYLFFWTIRELKFYDRVKWLMLEIKIPEEVEKTPKAMENIFHTIWTLYDPPANMKDYWVDGRWTLYYSLEIIGKKGDVRFLLRTPSTHKQLLEYALYAEYPNIEIKETEDYVKKFGDLPNENYDIWGADLALFKPDVYPLRTYEYWETELTRPEKKIDPMAMLFEFLTGLDEEQEIWIQIRAQPSSEEVRPYIKESQGVVQELMKRAEQKPKSPLEALHIPEAPTDMISVVTQGTPIPERGMEKQEAGFDIGLMKLSPGETEVVRSIEDNLAKYIYEVNIRFLYIGKRGVFAPPKGVPPTLGFFSQFSTINLNGLKPDKTKTKVMPWFFEKRRLFTKKRKLYRYYAARMWPWHRKPYVFSTAELATIFHFPSKEVTPSVGVPRVEMKKGGAPPELPI